MDGILYKAYNKFNLDSSEIRLAVTDVNCTALAPVLSAGLSRQFHGDLRRLNKMGYLIGHARQAGLTLVK